MTVIRWEEPPRHHGNAKRAGPIADALRAKPRRWAVVLEDATPGAASGFAHRIRNGAAGFAPSGHFEARAVGPAGGSSSKVYARYVGPGGAS